MSSDFKLDIIYQHDPEEPGLGGRMISEKLLDERTNSMHTVRKQGNLSINNFATNAERRALNDRFLLKANKATISDNVSLDEEERHHLLGSAKKSGPLISGVAYCISSCSMIMLNKIVLSGYNFNAGVSLMLYQNFISTLVVVLLVLSGRVAVEKLSWRLIRVWIPVNVVFIGMLVSGMYSLKYINVAMVTILKNMTNILTAIGELYLFRKRQNPKVWTAMFMMFLKYLLLITTKSIQIISAVSAGITDLSFDTVGYAWQIINCVLTATYSVCLFILCFMSIFFKETSDQFDARIDGFENENLHWIKFQLCSIQALIICFPLCGSLLLGGLWMKQKSQQNLDLLKSCQWCC
ncbi:hypothetical protein V8G54_034018 [Vigna mungo]|uniref:Uncharacterized protein n=1 Tax=Vigna mungo TaxID=3915 RepID=A0AAQ3RKA5_VIGMU